MKSFNKKLREINSALHKAERDIFELLTSDKYDLSKNSIKIEKEKGFSEIFEVNKVAERVIKSIELFESKINILTNLLNMVEEFYVIGIGVNMFELCDHISENMIEGPGPKKQIFTNKETAINNFLEIQNICSQGNYAGAPYKLFKYNRENGLFEEMDLT